MDDKAKEDFENALEITKVKKDDAHLYKLPPMKSSEGHTTADFTDLIFRGKMRMAIKDKFLLIYFYNSDGTPFLVSIIDENIEKYVLRVSGSVRYFTLKIFNKEGKLEFYGLGKYRFNLAFKQRNDSFDFYSTLMEFKDKLIFERDLDNKKATGEEEKKIDFSLKQGEKIKLEGSNIGTIKTNNNVNNNKDFKFKFSAPGGTSTANTTNTNNQSTNINLSNNNNVPKKQNNVDNVNLIDL